MRKLRLVLTMLLVITGTAPSYAGAGHSRGSVFIGVGGFGCCFGGFGFGGFWPPFGWGYAPPPPPWVYASPAAWASVPPAMAMPPPATGSPTALAAPSATQSSAVASPPPKEAVWYYCPATSGYYPYVPTCSMAWQTVPTKPQQSDLAHAPARTTPAPATRETPVRAIADTPTAAFVRGIGASHQGEPQILAEFTNSAGQPCQVLERTVVVAGVHQRATAIVCERNNGHWVIATEESGK